MSKAMRVFERLLFKIGPLSSMKYPNEPGYLIKRLSEEDQEALSHLKSDDLNGDRPEFYVKGTQEYYQAKQSKQQCLNFDKRLRT